MVEIGPQNMVSTLFLKNLFPFFEISAFKVRKKHGIHCPFHSFSEKIIGKPSSVTSQVIKAP